MFVKSALFAALYLLAPASGSYYNTPDDCTDDLIELLGGMPRFSTLLTAIQTAGLTSTLRGIGPFTIFAPTNNAFKVSLGDSGVETILDDSSTLQAVLKYHVLPINLESSDVAEVSYSTLEGNDIEFTFVGADVVVNDLAEIVTFDICGSNGLIHAIDRVLIPPGPELGFTPPPQCTGKGKGKGYNGSGNDCRENQPFCTGKGKGKGYSGAGTDCVEVVPPAIPTCDGKGKGKGYSGTGKDCISGPRPCAGKGKGKGFNGSGTDCFGVPPFCSGKGKGKGYNGSGRDCTTVPPYCTGKGKGKGFNGSGRDCTPIDPPATPNPTRIPTRSPTRPPFAPAAPACSPEGTYCNNDAGDYCCTGFFCIDNVCSTPCKTETTACSVSNQNCCDDLVCQDTDGGDPNVGRCVEPCKNEFASCMVFEQNCCDDLVCEDTDGGDPSVGRCVEPCKNEATECMMSNPNCCGGLVCLDSDGGDPNQGLCQDPPTRAPVNPPTRAPVNPPTRAPVDPPTRAPVDPPTRAPVNPPTRAPVNPPTRAPRMPPTPSPVTPPTRAPVTPPTRAPRMPPTPSPVAAPVPSPTCNRNIYFTVNNNANSRFDYFTEALVVTGLDEVLKDTTATFTVFAPTDFAFTTTFGSVNAVKNALNDVNKMRDIILFHILDNKNLYSDDLMKREYINALGESLEISFVDHDIVINDEAEILPPYDICAKNGVIHPIDRVLLPFEDEQNDDYKH